MPNRGRSRAKKWRAPDALVKRMTSAAGLNGVTLDEEISRRLARSFDIEDRLGGPDMVKLT